MFLGQRQVTVENPSKSVAFMVRLRLTLGKGGEHLTPIFWEDNYFSLLPRGKKEVSGRYELSSVAGKQAERPPPCFPLAGGMCYNHRAVEHGAKRGVVPVSMEPAEAASGKSAQEEPSHSAVAEIEDVSRYCPVCSQRLESRRCKLICGVCGYYMSCADYH